VKPQLESASGVPEGKRALDPSMNDSTLDWSLNKDRGRRTGGSEDDEDKDYMLEESIDSPRSRITNQIKSPKAMLKPYKCITY